MTRLALVLVLSLSLIACANRHTWTTADASYLQQGKRDFKKGYYKRAMHKLLPLACDGNPEAQYAVGYMYYYGYGVAQDTDVGTFWIGRSSGKHYIPAMQAMSLIRKDKYPEVQQSRDVTVGFD